jgi:hypothetical protein
MESHVARMGKLKMTQSFCGKMRRTGFIVRTKYSGVNGVEIDIKSTGQLGVSKLYVP